MHENDRRRGAFSATIVTVHDPNNFTTSRYHLEERLVTKEDAEGQVSRDGHERLAIFCILFRWMQLKRR